MYDWNEINSQWVADYKYEFTCDYSYNTSDLILPYSFSDDDGTIFYNNMLTGAVFYEWDNTLNEWVKEGKVTYYYSEQYVNSVPEAYRVELSVYPNPFSTYVSFNISGNYNEIILEIFDIQGRKIISKEIKNGENVNMEGLNTGMYFYNLTIDGEKLNGKLIKK